MTDHQIHLLFWIFCAAYTAASAVITSLPLPTDKSSDRYRWWHLFLSNLLINLRTVMPKKP